MQYKFLLIPIPMDTFAFNISHILFRKKKRKKKRCIVENFLRINENVVIKRTGSMPYLLK